MHYTFICVGNLCNLSFKQQTEHFGEVVRTPALYLGNPGLDLGLKTGCPESFHGFPHFFQANVKIILMKLAQMLLTCVLEIPSFTLNQDASILTGFSCLSSVPPGKFQDMKSTIFWDITLCSPLGVIWRFRGTYHLHLQGWKNNFCKTLNGVHSVTSQKMVLFITTTVRTSNPTDAGIVS
jgi:hypothetical protein